MPHLIGTGYLKNEDGDIYDLFLILVRAHHPVAAHSYQDATHTFDETKWKRILNEIQAELFEECKHQGPDSLIKLACEGIINKISHIKSDNDNSSLIAF